MKEQPVNVDITDLLELASIAVGKFDKGQAFSFRPYRDEKGQPYEYHVVRTPDDRDTMTHYKMSSFATYSSVAQLFPFFFAVDASVPDEIKEDARIIMNGAYRAVAAEIYEWMQSNDEASK